MEGGAKARKLALTRVISEEIAMADPEPLPRSRFEYEATESLAPIKAILSRMLANLEVRRPVELQRKLKLDVTLSWQLFKVAGEQSILAAGAAMPSRTNVEKFARLAGRNGIDADQIASLSNAYERFERVVERHAGDRTSFISLITAAAGLSDDWLAADLQHRRNMYRGMSHVMGVQARVRIGSYLLAPMPPGGEAGFQLVVASGYLNMRTLRNVDRVRVYGARIQGRGEGSDFANVQRRPLDNAGEGSLLEQYCSQPLPAVQVDAGELLEDCWSQTSLVRPDVGNLGVSTVLFGEKFWFKHLPTNLKMVMNLPAELLIQDLIVPRGLIAGEPALEVFLGDDRPTNRAPDLLPVIGRHEFKCLGVGPEPLTIADMPRYGEMITALAASTSVSLADYEVWRVRLEFPIYQSTSRISWRGIGADGHAT